MRPDEFYGMPVRKMQAEGRREKLLRGVLLVAFVLVFVAGIVLGWGIAKW